MSNLTQNIKGMVEFIGKIEELTAKIPANLTMAECIQKFVGDQEFFFQCGLNLQRVMLTETLPIKTKVDMTATALLRLAQLAYEKGRLDLAKDLKDGK